MTEINTGITTTISEDAQVSSDVSGTIDITADIDSIVYIASDLCIDNVTIDSGLDESQTPVSYDTYTGDYEVTSFLPTNLITTSVVLGTRAKLMTDNVTIYSLPVTEEYNEEGGVTITIGE